MKSTCVRMTAIAVLLAAALLGMMAQADTCALPSDPATVLGILFPLVDANGDGGLSLTELGVLYAGIPAQYFDIADANHDGKVSIAELTPFLSLLPGGNLLSMVDTNGNGAIEYAEVSQYVTPAQFALLDKDSNGVINCADLGTVTPPVEGETPPPPPPPPCPLPDDILPFLTDLLIPVFDTDHSGGLSLAEVQALYPIPAQYVSYFSLIDFNHNGQVDPEELMAIASALGIDLLGTIDTSGDRIIQYSEVAQYVSAEQFALLDRNGNGAFDCGDTDTVTPPNEGEPAEGETPPAVCPLPDDVVVVLGGVLIPLFDMDHSDGLSLAELQSLYPIPAEYASYFSLIDFNHDGQIDASELATIASALGVDLLGEIDTNGDRVIQYSEVSQYVTAAQFALLDRNGNGAFDCGDLTTVSPEGEGETALPCAIPSVNSLLFDAVFAVLDANHDGGIDIDEITRIASLIPGLDTSQVQIVFNVLGAGGNGKITRAALDLIPALLPALGVTLPDTNLLGLIDTNGDGLIQLSEASPYVSTSIFVMLDTNANGVLDCEDLSALISGHIIIGGGPNEGEVVDACPLPDLRSMLPTLALLLDKNHDGRVCEDEIADLMAPLMNMVPSAVAVDFFALADQDGDGCLNAAELGALANLVPLNPITFLDGNEDGVLEQNEVAMLLKPEDFAVADANHNGAIDCEDLAAIMALLGGNEGEPVEGEPPVEGEGEVNGLNDLLNGLHGSRNLGGLLEDAFTLLDANGDNALSYGEITARLQLPRAVFNAADTNGDGLVTLEEVSALAQQAAGQPESVIELVREVAGRFGNRFFAPGDVIRVTLRLIKHGDGLLNQLHLMEALPEGWTLNLISGAAGVSVKSVPGNALVLDWSAATAFPLEIVYEATAPAAASGLVTVTGQADYQTADGTAQSTGTVASILAEALPQDETHTADVDRDWHLSLSEVLRVVQLYNAGGYGAAAGTEDGYAPGISKQTGVPHDADYTGDWVIDISELLRVVQLFNAPGGVYYRASGTEDGFVPGLF